MTELMKCKLCGCEPLDASAIGFTFVLHPDNNCYMDKAGSMPSSVWNQLMGDSQDAKRYQWLRSNNVGPSMIDRLIDDYSPPLFTLKCDQELDAAIDAEILKEQGNG